MNYGQIKNRQKIEVSCGDPSKYHLVFNLFRAPTPLEKFRYAATVKWKQGVVVEKMRLKSFCSSLCDYNIIVAFNEKLIRETTQSHRNGWGFLPVGYLKDYVEDIDYAYIHFKDKESFRVRPVQNVEPVLDLSEAKKALAEDPWALNICMKDADDWTEKDLEKVGRDFFCKNYGGTLENIKGDVFIDMVKKVKAIGEEAIAKSEEVTKWAIKFGKSGNGYPWLLEKFNLWCNEIGIGAGANEKVIAQRQAVANLLMHRCIVRLQETELCSLEICLNRLAENPQLGQLRGHKR